MLINYYFVNYFLNCGAIYIRFYIYSRNHKKFQRYCEPRVVSLGPIYHCKPEYELLEKFKLILAKDFIEKSRRPVEFMIWLKEHQATEEYFEDDKGLWRWGPCRKIKEFAKYFCILLNVSKNKKRYCIYIWTLIQQITAIMGIQNQELMLVQSEKSITES